MTSNLMNDVMNDVMDEDVLRMNMTQYTPATSHGSGNSYKRPQSMKREKSHTDSIEREKKRVKFSTNNIEYSYSKVRPGKENQKCRSGKNIEKGILKNKYLQIDTNCDMNWISVPPEEKKENLGKTKTEKLTIEIDNGREIQRQNTFTKEQDFLIDSQDSINKGIEKEKNFTMIENTNSNEIQESIQNSKLQDYTPTLESSKIQDYIPTSKSFKYQDCTSSSKSSKLQQCTSTPKPPKIQNCIQTSKSFKIKDYTKISKLSKFQNNDKTSESSKLHNSTGISESSNINSNQKNSKIKEPSSKTERNVIKPIKSELNPKIIDMKTRKGSPRFKRVLSSQNTGSEEEDKRRKCLKTEDQTCNNRNIKNNKETSPEKRIYVKHPKNSSSINSSREYERIQDVQILRDQIKISEEKLKEKNIRERDLIQQQKTLKEQFDLATSKIIRNNKREATIMLSELKAKERTLSKLEKALNRQTADKSWENSSVQNEQPQNNPIPRPSLIRSVSAAAAIGRRVRPQILKLNKSLNKDDNSTKLPSVTRRDELIGKRSGAQKRYVSKLEEMRKQIEDQQREIAALNERLREQNPNLKSLSQLSVSVPTVYDPDKDEKSSRSTSRCSCGFNESKNETAPPFVSNCTPVSAYADNSMNYINKESELSSITTMSNYDEARCQSLDLFSTKRVLKEQAQPFHYSSLISLTGNRRESELAEENELLRAELQETRDHAELLEFRILEFTEGIQRATNVVSSTRDQSTNTCADDVTTPPPPISEDLSLPLSVDSGLELSVDFNKSRLLEYRKSLSKLEEASSYNEATSVNHLSSLLDWISSISFGSQYEVMMSPRSPTQKKMGVSSPLEDHRIEETIGEHDLTMLATKLQESLANPKMQEEVLEETISKLRLINTSLARLHSRVNSLTQENKELQEALHVLHESHETRTEASGTESELVNGKSPSLHSDISDSESDESSRPAKAIETSTSFQESGIFESSCEMVNAVTQTHQTYGTNDIIKDIEINGEHDQESLSREKSLEDVRDFEKSEVDLKTALERLTSIKYVVQGRDLKIRLQDLQESDECLVAAVEGEKVTLCKIEYDSIVATERSLQREIEMLQYEKDQLALQCAALEERLQRNTNRDDLSEVLRAQVRLIDERLEESERLKRLYFDEKCELEEAENDARLLSQRLESQLEAAREMESLLSASLSQEQEFCRELQRRVREMHAIDKGRRMHEEILEKESQFCRRREEALMIANDSQKSQLTFALYGLILAQFWRRYAAHNNKAIVPYTLSVDNNLLMELSEFSAEASFVPTFPCVSECDNCLNSNNVHLSDAFTQTAKSEVVEEDLETFVDGQSDKIQTKFNADGLTEREEYYLVQIETLQKERKTLREDYENEQTILYEQLQNMKSDLERLQQNLEESQRDKCTLIFKLEEAQAVINSSEIELDKQAKELKREFNKSVEAYQQEQKAIQEQYEERIHELRRNVEIHEQRFGALLQQYSVLQHELEPYFQSSDGDEYSSDGGSSSKIITTKDLLSAVRELVRSELSARQKLNELEKKESAYRETINEADRIMSSHVTMYTRRIEELEGALEQKTLRIKQLETSEERLRTTMKSNWKSSEGTRITELLDRLIETENSELNLKERVWNLERNGKELQIKFVEAEKAQENLRSELRDQEELVQRLMSLSTENNALTTQLQEAHEATRRASDIQQSENYLKNRVDELELSENGLRDTLKQTEQIIKQRERKFKDQLSNLEGEIASLKGQLEAEVVDSKKAKDVESSLRQQIDNFKGQIHNLEKDLKDSSSESICHETQHRSEVTKLRSQLKLANSQLTDLDILNGELKERFEAAEAAMKEVALQLEERSKRYEHEVLSLNLQLAQKESKLEECEVQMQHYSHPNVARELDYLATSPLVHLQQALDTFIKNMQNCQTCRNNNSSQFSCYQTLTDCLKTLNELINGRVSLSDSDSDDFETPRVENLANESSTSPPTPTQDGFDNLSGEGETSSVYSLTLTNESGTDAGDRSSMQSLPMVPPRPRRDAKKKKKIRKVNKNEASLLDELEESASIENGSFYGQFPPSVEILEELEAKVRELEEVISRKDEELRLADEEANDLQSRLMKEDEQLTIKTEEACKSNDAIITLRQQLLFTVEEYEKARHQLEAKHKVDMKELSKRIETLTEDLLRLTKKAHLKDKLIDTLVRQIRSILRSSSTTIVVNQIRQISRDFKRDGKQAGSIETDLEIVDFDVEKVCKFLEQTIEEHKVSAELESSSTSQLEVMTYQSLPSLTTVESAKVVKKSRSASDAVSNKRFIGVARDALDKTKACLTPRNLPPLDQNKKSRIPRFRPLSGQSLKHDDYLLPKEFSTKPIIIKRNKSIPPAEVPVKPTEVKQELKPLAKVVPKQRPMAKVTPKPKTPLEDAPSKFLSDARKIKRMVTGLTPLNATVDCSAAPEFKSQARPPVPSCVPRPVDLRITRRVGIDGAVIAWKPLEHDCVSGFQVIVGGRVVQLVRSPHRTKALVTGLPFPSPFTIGLVTVAQDGRCSVPAIVTYDKPNTYKTKATQKNPSPLGSNNVTPRRAVPTCL